VIKNVSFVEYYFDNTTNLVNEEIKKNIDTPFLIGDIVYVVKSHRNGKDVFGTIKKVKITEIQVNCYDTGITIMYKVTNGEDSYYVEAKDITKDTKEAIEVIFKS